MIKAVLFDVDGVLLDSKEANAKYLENLIVKSGYPRPKKKDLDKVFHISLLDSIKLLTKEKNKTKITKLWKQAELKKNYPVDLIRVPENIKETMVKLSKKYKLGIITSRAMAGVEEFFHYTKLENYFRVVVASDLIKNPKPDPESLLFAMSKLKVKPNETVYIGDSRNDLIASKKAGAFFILYSNYFEYPLLKAGMWTRDFRNLPRLISIIGRKRSYFHI